MAQQDEFMQMLMAAQNGKLPDEDADSQAKKQPELSKQKILKAFEVNKRNTIDAFGKQAEMQRIAATGQANQMELMIDMSVQQARTDDALFLEEGVRSDELEAGMTFYIAQDDPEIKKAMTDFMKEMQAEMQKRPL